MCEISEKYTSYGKIDISTLFLHKAKVYFMCLKPLWWLITVLNMNNIHWFIRYIYITTNIPNLWNNRHKCYIFVQSHGIFYMHQVPIMVDYCIKYEQNQPNSSLGYRKKHIKFKKNIAVITQIWNIAQCYFKCISNTQYLITVSNMNKINPFFSEISQ